MKPNRGPVAGAVLNAFVIVAMLVWVIPTIALLTASVRPEKEVIATGWWTVLNSPLKITQHTLRDYRQVISTQGSGIGFRNSFIISSIGTILPVVIAALAAFGLAHLESRAKTVSYAMTVCLAGTPLLMTFAPVLRAYNRLGLSGTFLGLWLARMGYGLPFAVFMLSRFFGALPKDVFESSYIDGASPSTAFFRVALPLSVPALASLVIFQFLWVWNDLLVVLTYLGDASDVSVVSTRLPGLAVFQGPSWHLLCSAGFISVAVPLLVFFSLQKYFVRGILAGFLLE